jgi:hypothetical protein
MIVYIEGSREPFEYTGRWHNEFYGNVVFDGNKARTVRAKIPEFEKRVANLKRIGSGEIEFIAVPYSKLRIDRP